MGRLRRLAAAFALLAGASAGSHAQSANTTPYLAAAQDLGRWLTDVTNDGTRYPAWVLPNGNVVPSQFGQGLEGAAGVGLFFTHLHRHTGDPQALQMAIRAAEFERAGHVAGQYNSVDYLAGAAGSGLFLLALHERTGDARYIQWAADIAAWHEARAVRPAPGQRNWLIAPDFPRVYTGIPHGTAGIALFHLALFHRTGDERWRTSAKEGYAWIRANHAFNVDAQGALGFRRLVVDTAPYTWWSGGTAGIMGLQAALYQSTGELAYFDDLVKSADGLIAVSAQFTNGRVWGMFPGAGSQTSAVVFSNGNGGVGPALLLAYEVTGEQRFEAAAKDSLRWVEGTAQSGAGVGAQGLYWFHNMAPATSPLGAFRSNGAFVGTASIAWMFGRMFPLLDDERLRGLSLQGADYLLSIADTPSAGRKRWINYMGPYNTTWGDEPRYGIGWYDGNAGIGIALLAAHEIAIGQRPRLDVHAP